MGWNPTKTFKPLADSMEGGSWLDANKKQTEQASSQQRANVSDQFNANNGVAGQMKTSDDTYQSKMGSIAGDSIGTARTAYNDWNTKATGLQTQAATAANDARQVYTGTVQPELKNIMETAKSNAGSAMSLKDYQDPNNAVQTAYRNMYEQQAQGVNREGMADAGVLGAMGTQATANIMGNGMPMTGGQLAAIQGMNMTQASGAVANAQQYAQKLRDQGIQTGIQQNDKAYQAGQDAQKSYADSVNNIQSADNSFQGVQAGLRGEQYGYANDTLTNRNTLNNFETGMDMGNASLAHDLATDQGNRQIGLNNSLYGGDNSILSAGITTATAEDAANKSLLGGVLGAVGGAAGASLASKGASTGTAAATK